MGGGGGGGGGATFRFVLLQKCPVQKDAWARDKSGTKRDIFSWTFSIEVNPDSKPDKGLKQPRFSLTGLIDEF